MYKLPSHDSALAVTGGAAERSICRVVPDHSECFGLDRRLRPAVARARIVTPLRLTAYLGTQSQEPKSPGECRPFSKVSSHMHTYEHPSVGGTENNRRLAPPVTCSLSLSNTRCNKQKRNRNLVARNLHSPTPPCCSLLLKAYVSVHFCFFGTVVSGRSAPLLCFPLHL